MKPEDYGIDFAQRGGDFLVGLPTQTGRRLLLEDLVRRFETPEGFLFESVEGEYPWDPRGEDYGFDLRAQVGAKIRNTDVLARRIETECLKDDRVVGANAQVTLVGSDRLEITIRVEDGDGPFELTIHVSELTVEAFLGEAA